jgi:hypothetical protein
MSAEVAPPSGEVGTQPYGPDHRATIWSGDSANMLILWTGRSARCRRADAGHLHMR